MTGGPLIWLLYAVLFVAVVLAVEGLWLVSKSTVGSKDLNRRLGLIRKTGEADAALALIAKRDGGAVSAWIDSRYRALRDTLWAARLPISSAQLLGGAGAAALVLTALFALFGLPPLLALVAGPALGFGGPLLFVHLRAGARRRRFLEQFPYAVDLIARSLQAGHPVPVAVRVVAQQMADPIGTEFGLVVDEMTYGADREQALRNLADRFPASELMMFVAAVQVTRETGGNLAEVFLKLSEVLRGKERVRKKVKAISAEGRMSCFVVSALPVVVGLAIMTLRREYYTDVASDPWFWPMMSVPPLMLATGVAVIWRMVNFKY
jgi:tight adherence protein B